MSRNLKADDLREALRALADRGKAEFFQRFFKKNPDNPDRGDRFLGVIVPKQREVAKQFRELSLHELEKLLADPIHECRLTALFILVNRFEKARDGDERMALKDFYLANLDGVNHWDLVDSSAHKILGEWLVERKSERCAVLGELAESSDWFRQRVAVIACFPLIRRGEFGEIFWLAEGFVDHPHDLIHKAVGWMLREMGKRDVELLRGFLEDYAAVMPRVMLRYSIEKLDKAERGKWVGKRKRQVNSSTGTAGTDGIT